MLLAIDIGNTNISFGVFPATKSSACLPSACRLARDRQGFSNNYGKKGNSLIKRFDIPTKKYSLKKVRKNLGSIYIDDVIVCSVVPAATKILAKDLKRLFHYRPYILGRNIKVPIKNLYRQPEQVGQDRLVNAYAGVKFYGAPLIIVDFGTAVTLDAVSRNKEYLGGMILPGLGISLDVLTLRTALLPKVKLNPPKELIGRDTKNSMLSGIVHGFAGLTDDLALKIKEKIGRNAKIIGTGGNINLIARFCKRLDRIDKDLTLKGLNLIYSNR